MPQHATTIRIAEPCTQSWDAMTPASGGRHCAACQKTVVDFSQMADAELLAHLAQANRAGTCGRLRADQLGRALVAGPAGPRAGRWRAALGAFLAAFSLSSLDAARAAAHAGQPMALATPNPSLAPVAAPQAVAEARPLAGSYRAEGVVLDAQTHQPIPGATVLLQGTGSGVGTDEQGKFVLPITSTQLKITLVISAVGYEIGRRELDLRAVAEPFIIQLKVGSHVLGGLGLVSPPPTRWQRVARLFA